MKNYFELSTTLTGFQKGKACALQPYKARLLETSDRRLILEIGQPLSDGGYSWSVSSWYLDAILEFPTDSFIIDFGQDWMIFGCLALISEIRKHTTSVLKEKL
jgi:hypothetical protein